MASDEEALETLLEGSSLDFDWGADDLDETATQEVDVIRFRVAGQPLAIEGQRVREVIAVGEITALPGAPAYIPGVTVYRRQVLGLLDLASWLQLGSSAEDWTRILVVEAAGYVAGILVPSVAGIESWPSGHTDELPESVDEKLRACSLSARWAPGGVVVMLDIEKILRDAAPATE